MRDQQARDLFAYDRWESRAEQSWGQAARTSPFDQIDFHVDLGCGRLPKARIGVDRYPAPGVAVVADLDAGITYAIPRKPNEEALVDGKLWPGNASGETGALYGEYDYAAHVAAGNEFLSVALPRTWRLPFADSSIESIISHHFFEHVGEGFIPLIDDIYRVLVPGGILRAITPLFPSWSAVSDPDHRRYFMAGPNSEGGTVTTWESFCGSPGDEGSWLNSFSVPYTTARFECVDTDYTPALIDPHGWWTPIDARELRVALKAVK